jgi:hypothetical protein
MASVFGIVTLSAIIQFALNSLQALSIFDVIPYVIPLILPVFLYFSFAFAGYHTITSYFYYAGIADRITEIGFIRLHLEELNKLRYIEENEVKRLFRDFGLYDSITKIDNAYAKSVSKKVLSRPYLFKISYGITLIVLTVVVYWKIFILI